MTTKTKKRAAKKAGDVVAAEKVLIMRTVAANGESHGGFRWPLEGRLERRGVGQ